MNEMAFSFMGAKYFYPISLMILRGFPVYELVKPAITTLKA
jgi:hypothetical protein